MILGGGGVRGGAGRGGGVQAHDVGDEEGPVGGLGAAQVEVGGLGHAHAGDGDSALHAGAGPAMSHSVDNSHITYHTISSYHSCQQPH